MQTTTRRSIFAQASLALFVALFAATSFVNAGVINHGTVSGPGVMYIDVTESSSDPTPLYGAPITVGDQLAFFEPSSPNPSLGFNAQAAGGSGDITDGFLNLTIMGKPGFGIDRLEFSEGGDYTMAQLGAALAQVSATLNVFQLNVTHVDGAALQTPLKLTGSDAVTFNLPPDAAQGNWDLEVDFNVKQALVDNGIDFVLGATKLTARVNNTLTALSQPGSVAGIFKKDFDITPDTSFDPNFVPEPTSLVLGSLGAVAIMARRRRAV